jgi:rhodanese-related sulfurtransferase
MELLQPEQLDQIPRITPQDLKRRLDAGEHPFIMDVRRHPDGNVLPGAVLYDPVAFLEIFNPRLDVDKDRLVVTYCA